MGVSMVQKPPHAVAVVILTLSLVALATPVVILRFCVRKWYRLGIKADDWFMLAALVLTWGMAIAGSVEALSSQRKADLVFSHPLPIQDSVWIKALFARELIYLLFNPCAKFSVLLFYRKLFPLTWFYRASVALAVISTMWFLAFFLTTIHQCRPVSAFWDPAIVDNHCADTWLIYKAMSGTNALLDFIILLMPIPLILGLNIKRKQKMQLIAIFAIGFSACVAALIHFVLLLTYSDGFYTNGFQRFVIIWHAMEMILSIISASLITLAPLLTASLPADHPVSRVKRRLRWLFPISRLSSGHTSGGIGASRGLEGRTGGAGVHGNVGPGGTAHGQSLRSGTGAHPLSEISRSGVARGSRGFFKLDDELGEEELEDHESIQHLRHVQERHQQVSHGKHDHLHSQLDELDVEGGGSSSANGDGEGDGGRSGISSFELKSARTAIIAHRSVGPAGLCSCGSVHGDMGVRMKKEDGIVHTRETFGGA